MASKDKTSKTARVMNLLSKKQDPADDTAAAGSTKSASVWNICTVWSLMRP